MEYKIIAKENMNMLLEDLKAWVKIDSVHDEKTISKKMPFGKGVHDSLEFIASLGEKYGFKVDRCDGYCSELSIGDGEKIIMIMGHGDVVPVGDGWKYDPFLGEVIDDYVYGRGSEDDKGPTLAALHALKYLKDQNKLNPDYKYVLVVGGNEERGSACLDYYFNKLKKPQPTYGFTPDAEFPLVYGEKGILTYVYKGEEESSRLVSLRGGIASNAVVGDAYATLRGEKNIDKEVKEYLEMNNLEGSLTYENNLTNIHFHGKIAHAAMPELGINALTHLLNFLKTILKQTFINHFAKAFDSYYGENLNIAVDGERMGKLTMNLGVGNYENGKYEFVINIRYPIDTTGEKVVKGLEEFILDEGELVSDSKPLYVDPNSKFIQTLVTAYQEISGDYETKIMTIGGGTYARNCQNSVAFGMCFPGKEELAHQVNERLDLESLEKGFAIYLKAIDNLGGL